MKTYTEIRSHAGCDDAPPTHSLWLRVDHQVFRIADADSPDREDVEWMQTQLDRALLKIRQASEPGMIVSEDGEGDHPGWRTKTLNKVRGCCILIVQPASGPSLPPHTMHASPQQSTNVEPQWRICSASLPECPNCEAGIRGTHVGSGSSEMLRRCEATLSQSRPHTGGVYRDAQVKKCGTWVLIRAHGHGQAATRAIGPEEYRAWMDSQRRGRRPERSGYMHLAPETVRQIAQEVARLVAPEAVKG
jgi:hypothetical protein